MGTQLTVSPFTFLPPPLCRRHAAPPMPYPLPSGPAVHALPSRADPVVHDLPAWEEGISREPETKDLAKLWKEDRIIEKALGDRGQDLSAKFRMS